ncbi:MAG: BON domain-containing protein [Desulfobulbaceae bacterium]|nr:BON domain-containing protein [Desulfobulbaceae bacterium]
MQKKRKIMKIRFMVFFFILFCGAGILPATALENLDDTDISSAIIADLLQDDAVPAHLIDVKVENGIVTLDGSVYNILARDRAEEIAESIKGVRSVVSLLEVKPPLRPDKNIRKDIETALLIDPATDSFEIGITVSNGKVTLNGRVDSFAERELSAEVVKGVWGVKEIANNIEVAVTKERPDYEIKAEIERLLQSDVRVVSENINVGVKENRVTLAGTVGSSIEKNRAGTISWVTGVEGVNNVLTVNWKDAEENLKRGLYKYQTSEEIEASVQDAFLYDPRVNAFDIDVASKYGSVTLRGTVDNLKARRAAEEDALNTTGVWSVINEIKVRPATLISDDELVERVINALKRNTYVKHHDILVKSFNSKVFLYGTTDTLFEKEKAEDAALTVNGVVDVQNNITTREQWSIKTDWEIKRDVESQLFWSPFVDSTVINVAVEDGVVTLTGMVDTWKEYNDAAENAYEGGARSVRNHLDVKEVAGRID